MRKRQVAVWFSDAGLHSRVKDYAAKMGRTVGEVVEEWCRVALERPAPKLVKAARQKLPEKAGGERLCSRCGHSRGQHEVPSLQGACGQMACPCPRYQEGA